jgi:tyrosine-protein phosphatase YwqE
VSRLGYAVPQWSKELKAGLRRAHERLARERVDAVDWFWPADEDPRLAVPGDEVRLLSPFDPVGWDRRRFELLWVWAYRFEAYTPVARRKLGYYALPLLWRDRVIGWANVSMRQGELRSDLGFVERRGPSGRSFKGALERELDRHRRAFDELAAAASGSARRLPEIRLGHEIWAPDAASLRRALSAPALGLGTADWLLVEFGFDLRGDHLDVIQAALDGGWRIVIAHPERYRPVGSGDLLEIAAAWHSAGALLQVNAGSLGGHYLRSSPDSRKLAWALVEQGLAGLVATDHHAANRPVSVTEAWDLLIQRGGEALARRLMVETPAEIANLRPLCPSPSPPLYPIT